MGGWSVVMGDVTDGKAHEIFVGRSGVRRGVVTVEQMMQRKNTSCSKFNSIMSTTAEANVSVGDCRWPSSSSRYAMPPKPQQCPRPKEKLPLPSSPAHDSTPIPKQNPLPQQPLQKASSMVVSLIKQVFPTIDSKAHGELYTL